MIQHEDRRNAASGLRTTRLSDAALIQANDRSEAAQTLAFADIRSVRLNVEMAGPSSQVVCRVQDALGNELVFGSMSWVRPGAWELKADTFRELLIGLHRALTPYRDAIQFLEGAKPGFMWTLFTVGGVAGTACLAGFAWLFLLQENAVGLFFLPGVLGGAWLMRVFWPRAPKPYDPDRYALAKPLEPAPSTRTDAG
ncbi:hypothetical protein [Maricaulis salignorans]|uniref:hypothetical protein n=1 Tax=Maricaulis salignorans TaxID=144026 RepID=UPI003A8CBCDA